RRQGRFPCRLSPVVSISRKQSSYPRLHGLFCLEHDGRQNKIHRLQSRRKEAM
ncbi:MAG: hypothetical protein, partial [Olavius algarvensis Gamma 1 endosymbiont]